MNKDGGYADQVMLKTRCMERGRVAREVSFHVLSTVEVPVSKALNP